MKNINELLEDLYASQYKIKKVQTQNPKTGDWEWHDRKVRTKRIDFKNSKMEGKPSQEVKEENMTIDEQINEVLSKDATAGDWIHDFVHSDNPKFDGKSQDKRKQMALAAYYAKQKNEEVTPIAPTLDRKYIKGTPENKAHKEKNKPINGHPTNKIKEGSMKSFKEMLESIDEATRNTEKRHIDSIIKMKEVKKSKHDMAPSIHDNMEDAFENGNHKKIDQLHKVFKHVTEEVMPNVKEEVETLDELSKSTLGSYAKKATRDAIITRKIGADFEHQGKRAKSSGMKAASDELSQKYKSKSWQRRDGVDKAVDRLTKEEVELQEANHREYASQGKMHPDMVKHMSVGQEHDYYEHGTGDKVSGKVMHKSATEVHMKQTHDSYDPKKKGTVHKFKISDKLDEDKKEDPPFDGPYTKSPATTKDKSGAVHTPMSRVKHLARQAMKQKMKEDIDLFFEAKDESEYGYEGDMAMSQLKTICRHAEHFMEMLEPTTDLPEWVQSKITLATDYIQTAHDYMMSEMNEELKGGQKKLDRNKNGKLDSKDFKMLRGEEEMHEATCPVCHKDPCECGHMKEAIEDTLHPAGAALLKHIKPQHHNLYKPHLTTDVFTGSIKDRRDVLSAAEKAGHLKEDSYPGLEAMKKMGLPTAARSTHPRGVNIDTVEGWDHPHDAVKKKEKVQKEETDVEKRTISFSDFINEIKMADLPKRSIKGSSYGAQYHDPEGADDAFERKPKQVAKSEPEVKRGRGRPAGSKSGANQKVSSGTKRTGVDYSGYKLHLPNSNR